MEILTSVLVEAVKVIVSQTIILLFKVISTKKRKKKTTRLATNKTGKSSSNK
ncbi:hypothetical protein ACWV26_01420 [Rummeliibacillus sp. JY-2-4R]